MSKSEINDFIQRHYKKFNDAQIAKLISAEGIKIGSQAIYQRRKKLGLMKNGVIRGVTALSQPSKEHLKMATPKKDNLGKVAELLEKSGIPLEEIDSVQSVRINAYQGLTKDADGEVQIHDLEAASLVLKPKWADGPAWPVVQPADPVKIVPLRIKKRDGKGYKTAVILPDVQIGFRRDIVTGELDPFHDEKAMDIAIQVIRELQPDLIINLGDLLDFAQFGKYTQEASFALTTQAGLNRAHKFLADQRANAPHAEIRLLEGNHSRRLPNMITNNAVAAFGLQRANEPESWPVMSVPHLLRLDELGVEFISGYPANITWINDRLACIHGHKVRSSGSTASAVVDDERVSIIFGHVHRIEAQSKTRNTREGARTVAAWSPGCLCRIDGAVPGVKGSTDIMGRPIKTAENWAQGLMVVTYGEGDQPFWPEQIGIFNGLAFFRGKPLFASQLNVLATT